ncbi:MULTISPECIES: hypothetical protein [Pedobacter]|uniref:Uncharacterized protein n=2 Tax=Pedobacter TaxID=84567 RepID=A0A3N0BY17_9SPHI|nr:MULTISPECIES: hypothetical protein [Pedobacter]RNL54610.1 hypothetical protein D7004_07425 [Pedobacter jejuensis]GGI23355.1 hypothetical protein GCM10008119_07230 [Pedobacter mendelii]
MKTTVIESKAGKINSSIPNSKPENNGEQPKVNGLPVSKEFDGKAKPETEVKKAETPVQVSEQQKPQADAPKEGKPQAGQAIPEATKAEAEQPKAEPTKTEVKEVAPQKIALNLESTLKLVEELHRRKMQRDRLLDTIDTLEAFEIAQQEDAEETDSNHFQGCVLTIEDDERRKFSTKNPVIIQAVAQFVNRMCVDRLAEIEAGITIPA